MKKLLIVVGVVAGLVLVSCVGLSVIAVMLSSRQPAPKAPGEAAFEAANNKLGSYKGTEAFGNNADAQRLAQEFSTAFRAARELLFTKDKKGGVSLTEDHFLTYCQLDDDSVAFIVHVPDLRKFESEAKKDLAEIGWITAQETLKSSTVDDDDQLAVGLRGAVVFSDILIGKVAGKPPAPAKGLREVLYPFFNTDGGATPTTADGSGTGINP